MLKRVVRWSALALLLCLAVTGAISALHENIGPGGDQNKTLVTKARSGQYSLIQRPAHLKSCDEDGGWPCYQTTVHFRDKSKPDQVLPEVGLAREASYQMAADYIISPDEHWFVRDQHLFAGCNTLVLYKVEPEGKVHEEQSDLVDLALKCVLEDLHRAGKTQLSSEGFFHFSGEDVVWDRASDALRFKLFARPDPPDPSIRDCLVRYDLPTRKMKHGKIPLGDSKTGDNLETVTVGATEDQ
jgi:hypothetical protein